MLPRLLHHFHTQRCNLMFIFPVSLRFTQWKQSATPPPQGLVARVSMQPGLCPRARCTVLPMGSFEPRGTGRGEHEILPGENLLGQGSPWVGWWQRAGVEEAPPPAPRRLLREPGLPRGYSGLERERLLSWMPLDLSTSPPVQKRVSCLLLMSSGVGKRAQCEENLFTQSIGH